MCALFAEAPPPAWLAEITSRLNQWHSQRRLERVFLEWKKRRESGDEWGEETFDSVQAWRAQQIHLFFDKLEAWHKQELHLWAWEENQRVKSLRRRREFYRIFAADLAKKYETLFLEDFDLSKIARHQDVESDDPENMAARSNRQLAAVGELRAALINAFESRGGRVRFVSAVDTTRTCSACGHVEKFDAAAYLHHRCSKCKELWDQDENAGANILERGLQLADEPPPSSKRETKWARLKREKAAKEQAKEPVDPKSK